MSRSFTLNQLTEGIRDRDISAEGNRLMSKWNRTGLLRGLTEHNRETMARLLENQAAQLLRESNTLSNGAGSLGGSGDIQGFTNIAFPIVRRVFGGLVANELVSIQPMSLPSGLLFYLDYTYGTDVGGDDARGNITDHSTGAVDTPDGVGTAATYRKQQSIYGSPTGREIRDGSNAVGGNYDLVGSTYSKVHSASMAPVVFVSAGGTTDGAAGAFAGGATFTPGGFLHATGSDGKLIQFDVQLTRDIEDGGKWIAAVFDFSGDNFPNIDSTNVKSVAFFSASASPNTKLNAVPAAFQQGNDILNLRRLNQNLGWFKFRS
jgi:hypothetical protein